MIGEEWRSVPGFPLLEASSWGRIRSRPYEQSMPRGGRKINVMAPTYGIPSVAASGARHKRWQVTFRRKSLRVARLVCLAFHGEPPPGKPYSLHRDENSANNRPENLLWGTQKENLNAPGFLKYAASGAAGSRTYIDRTRRMG